MKNIVGIVAVATLAAGFSGGSVAADLIIEDPMVAPALTDDGSVYLKVYGGVVIDDSVSILEDDYDLDAGWLFGGAVGMDVFAPGLAVELDATVSSAAISDDSPMDGAKLNGVTVMADLVYTAPLSDALSAYFGAGLGVVGVQVEDYGFGYGAGGQVFAGLSMSVADNVSVFGELRYQGAFSTIDADGWEVDFRRTAVLAGLKLSF